MPKSDGQKRGWNEVGLLLLNGADLDVLLLKLSGLSPRSTYLQGAEMAISAFQTDKASFALIGA